VALPSGAGAAEDQHFGESQRTVGPGERLSFPAVYQLIILEIRHKNGCIIVAELNILPLPAENSMCGLRPVATFPGEIFCSVDLSDSINIHMQCSWPLRMEQQDNRFAPKIQ